MNVVVFDPNDLTKVIAIILSFLAAALSYHAVEMPFRRRTLLAGRQALAVLLAATTVAGVTFGALVWQSGGWPGRLPAGAENMAAVASQHIPDPEQCFVTGAQPNRFCHAANGGPLDIVLIGDSHAQSLMPAVRQFAQDQGLTAGFALRADCAPLVGVWREKDVQKLCPQFAEEAMAFLAETKPRIVILAARWSVYTVTGRQLYADRDRVANDRATSLAIFEAGLDRTLRRIAETGAVPVVVEQMPENAGDLPSSSLVLMRLGLPLDTVAARKSKHQKTQHVMSDLLRRASTKLTFVRIDPAIAFCPAERCTVEAGGRLLYSDNDHLNVDGSLFLLPYLSDELRKVLAQRPRS